MKKWLDKYDAPKAQNGIEGTMGGLTDKGFNYNGAWGGPSMQMGGNIQPPMAGADQTVPMYQMGGYVYPTTFVPQAQEGIDLNLPRYNKEEDKRVSIDPYMFGFNPEPGVNIHGIGAKSYLNILNSKKNKLDLTGDVNSVSVGYPGGVELFGKPQFSGGLRFTHTFENGGSLPGSVGFTYARTKGIPSEGPYGKKTVPSAQNGQEMQFYQNGLDWTPRNISKNGSEIPMAQPGITQPMRGDIQTRGNQNLLTEIAAQRTKEKKAQEARTKTTIGADTRTAKQKEKDRKAYESKVKYEKEVLGKDFETPQYLQEKNRARAEHLLHLADVGAMGSGLVEGIGKLALKNVPKPKTVEDLVDLYRVQEKEAKTFAQLAAEGKIPKAFNTPEVLARKAAEEKHFGQWFTNDKADLEWYMKDREFTNPEIIHLRVPKSKLSQYQNYDKTLSRAPEREFVIPYEEQKIYKQKKKGGVVKDNDGYWNPENWGKVVEIDSPNITMKGVNQDLIGVSDEGDVQYMTPGNDYKFKGKKVKEYPVGKYGVNQQDEKTVQHLDQLLNFTNKPKAKNGWLDKYK